MRSQLRFNVGFTPNRSNSFAFYYVLGMLDSHKSFKDIKDFLQ